LNRKEKIIKSASRLFADKGFDNTSTVEITEKAGVAHGTLFYHFKNKEGIIFEILKRGGEKYIEEINNAVNNCENGLEKIEAILRINDEFSRTHSRQLLIYLRDLPVQLAAEKSPIRELMKSVNSQTISVIKNSLIEGVKDKTIQASNPEETAYLLHCLIFGLTHKKLLSPLKIPDLIKCATKFCNNALTPRAEIIHNHDKKGEFAGKEPI